MTEVCRLPCPHAGCGSSDAFCWNTDKSIGHCKSCGIGYPSKGMSTLGWAKDKYPLVDRRSSGGWTAKEKESVDSYWDSIELIEEDEPEMTAKVTGKAVGDLKVVSQRRRGITEATLKHYGVSVYNDDLSDPTELNDMNPFKETYVYPSGGIKTRYIRDKGFSSEGGVNELWGMSLFAPNSSKTVVVTEGECFTPDAEMMTPKGWVKLGNLTVDDKVLQVNENLSSTFVNPLAIVDKTYSGDLVEYSSGSYYSLTTEGHNIPRIGRDKILKKYKASEGVYLNVPRVVSYWDTGDCGISSVELKIWIMLSADFTFRESGDIYGCFTKTRKVDRARELLTDAGIRHTITTVKGGRYSVFIHRGHGLKAKKDLPWVITYHSDKESLLDEVVFWDGHRFKDKNQSEFYSNRQHNIDVVQALSHMCGYVATPCYRTSDHGSWIKLSILYGKCESSTQNGYKMIPYSGRVMCVTVPSGMILVRQKGSVSVSGNCDTMAAWQMLKTAQYITPVVSVPSASPSAKVWENSKEWLDSFDKIILSVDNDKAGDALAEKMSKMFLGKVYRMNHGKHKDANDFLMAGDGKDYKAAWWGAKKVKPESILSNPDDYVNLFRTSPDFEYFETGIPELDEKMLGICKGYITLIQAKSGLGKSELMRYFEYQLLTNSDYKVASCRKEETNLRSLLGLVSYDIKQNVTLKKLVEEGGLQEKVEESIQKLTEDERFVTFTIDETQSNDDTMKQLRYMIAAMGVDYIFIEPIQDIVVGSNASEKEGKLSDLITRMGNLCGDTGVGIVVIAHENNDGGAMYSSMITKKAGFKITLSGDRESDDPQERNRTYLEIKEKNRVGLGFGKAGAIDFDIGTYTLEPVVRHEPVTKATKGDF